MSSFSTTTKHTQTPYAVKKGLHGNSDGVTIWQEKLPGMLGAKGIAKMSSVHEQDEVEATAAFIVRACNAHDHLVNAVKLAKDDHQRIEPHHANLCPICEAMDAALAAAEA